MRFTDSRVYLHVVRPFFWPSNFQILPRHPSFCNQHHFAMSFLSLSTASCIITMFNPLNVPFVGISVFTQILNAFIIPSCRSPLSSMSHRLHPRRSGYYLHEMVQTDMRLVCLHYQIRVLKHLGIGTHSIAIDDAIELWASTTLRSWHFQLDDEHRCRYSFTNPCRFFDRYEFVPFPVNKLYRYPRSVVN